MRKTISYVVWYLFWTATGMAAITCTLPAAGPICAAISALLLILYIWVSNEPLEDAYVLRYGIYAMQIISMLVSAFVTHNVTYFMVMGPTFLIHYHKEGGNRYAEFSS